MSELIFKQIGPPLPSCNIYRVQARHKVWLHLSKFQTKNIGGKELDQLRVKMMQILKSVIYQTYLSQLLLKWLDSYNIETQIVNLNIYLTKKKYQRKILDRIKLGVSIFSIINSQFTTFLFIMFVTINSQFTIFLFKMFVIMININYYINILWGKYFFL